MFPFFPVFFLTLFLVDNLRKTCKADHGYDIGSRVITNFFEVLNSFSPEDRRVFMRFVSGTPRLPIGGFAALTPRLTLVEKSIPGQHPDEILISVMTCVNYVKVKRKHKKGKGKKFFLTLYFLDSKLLNQGDFGAETQNRNVRNIRISFFIKRLTDYTHYRNIK